ncbi:MAG: transcriptional regulator [Syntrophorhabdaceae bacterium]|nr:transcriptional regulator [Syntrophorhabdaceae bacterium]
MSYKFDSLTIILNKIDSGEKVTVQSLMEALEVTERTIHRYMSTLLVAGFPVEYDRKIGSYVFSEGYALKKPALSIEETLAFALAKKLFVGFGPGMEKNLADIEDKLSIKKANALKHIVLTAEPLPAGLEQHLTAIHQAIINYQRVILVYKAVYADQPTESKVDPYYLFFRDGFWYLRGFYQLEEGMRTFALDRIASLSLLDEHFVPESISPEDELAGAFGAFVDGEPVEVVLKFDEDARPFIRRKKWHKSQKEKELADGRLEVRFMVNGIAGIRPWIYRWLPYVEIVAPRELRTALKADLIEAMKKHGIKGR